MGHPDAPGAEPNETAERLPETGAAEGLPTDPESAQTGTPVVSDLPTDPGDAGAVPRDYQPEPSLDDVVVTEDSVSKPEP